jgi:hypothetical protein
MAQQAGDNPHQPWSVDDITVEVSGNGTQRMVSPLLEDMLND